MNIVSFKMLNKNEALTMFYKLAPLCLSPEHPRKEISPAVACVTNDQLHALGISVAELKDHDWYGGLTTNSNGVRVHEIWMREYLDYIGMGWADYETLRRNWGISGNRTIS
jgi:hypothetical protein